MTRSRKSARAAGTRFESQVAGYLAEHVDDRIERRAKTGAKDRGDISGLRVRGQRVVVECKDYGGQLRLAAWIAEAEVERGNDDAQIAVVVSKRRGTADPADQYVHMTLRDFTAIATGFRPPSP